MHTGPPITAVDTRSYSLPLVKPWRSAKGEINTRDGWLVSIRTGNFQHGGWGDCAPLPEAGTEIPKVAYATLRSLLPKLIGLSPQSALVHLNEFTKFSPAALCGIETALLDLISQSANISLATWLKTYVLRSDYMDSVSTANLLIPVNAAIGTLDENIVLRAQDAWGAGYTILKVKLGLKPWNFELPRLRALANCLPAHVRLRVDANQAWPECVAKAALTAMLDFPIESVEEPLAGANFAILAKLQERVPFALALDESIATTLHNGLSQTTWLETYPVKRLILKPTVLGSISNAWMLSKQAQQLGLECVVTSTLESGIGVHAAAHLAAAIGGELSHGLATGSWFIQDVTAMSYIQNGFFQLPNRPGLGIVPVNLLLA